MRWGKRNPWKVLWSVSINQQEDSGRLLERRGLCMEIVGMARSWGPEVRGAGRVLQVRESGLEGSDGSGGWRECTAVLHLLFHCPNIRNSQSWTRLKSGVRSSFLVSHVSCRGSSTRAIFGSFLCMVARSWIESGVSGTQTGTLTQNEDPNSSSDSTSGTLEHPFLG